MPVTSQIIADSISPSGKRITSYEITCPVSVWIEILTHRLLSRSCSSTRAIPTARLREAVRRNPAIPTTITAYQKGMAANEPLPPEDEASARDIYGFALRQLLDCHEALGDLGVSKQDANTLLLGLLHYQAIVTATEWNNFFALRRSPAARPDLHLLADTMWSQREGSTPRVLDYGGWHLPYSADTEHLPAEARIAVSVARCARVSYTIPQTGVTSTLGRDQELFNRLVADKHLSPMEHAATPIPPVLNKEVMCGNYVGWLQYRKLIDGESGGDVDDVHLMTAQEAKEWMAPYPVPI